MTRDEIDIMWQKAMQEAVEDGEMYTRYRFAKLVEEKATAIEREACAKLVEPDEEHRRDALWGYLGGAEGVELLDANVAAIRARGQA